MKLHVWRSLGNAEATLRVSLALCLLLSRTLLSLTVYRSALHLRPLPWRNLDRACAFALGLVFCVSGEGRLCDLETCSLELEGTWEGKSTAFFIFLFGSVF